MDNFRFLLQSALDVARSKTNINLDIRGLQSQVDKLRIKAELDPKSLRDVRKQLELITKHKASGIGSSASISKQILNIKDLKAQERVYFQHVDNIIGKMSNRIEKKFTGFEFKNFDVSGIKSATNAMKDFTITASTAEGIVKKLNFENKKLHEVQKTRPPLLQANKSADVNNVSPTTGGFVKEERNTNQQISASWVDTILDGTDLKNWLVKSGSVKYAVNELKQIDLALNEISKSTGLTSNQLKELGDVSFETASKYGQKVSGFLTGIQEMYRAGYENAEQLAELSAMAQSAGGMEPALANDYLMASDAAYGYGGNIQKLTELLDGQNQVAVKNAISMKELANATKVSERILPNGTSIPEKEMTALLGTGLASSKESGENVARVIKNIIMNLQKIEGEGGFYGQIIDEDQLKKVEFFCHRIGVELEYVKNGVTSLRDPIDILKDLSEVYNSLPNNSVVKAEILSNIGGEYDSNILSSILSNFDQYEKMLDDYENSAGSAMRESTKSANDWEGTLNRLSNTFTDVIGSIADSDLIVPTINALNNLLEVLNKITSFLGSLGTLSAIGGGILSSKNVGSPKMFGLIKLPTTICVLLDTEVFI